MYTVYSLTHCPACVSVKNLLIDRAMPYVELIVGKDVAPPDLAKLLPAGVRSLPQVFKNEVYIGGLDAVREHLNSSI